MKTPPELKTPKPTKTSGHLFRTFSKTLTNTTRPNPFSTTNKINPLLISSCSKFNKIRESPKKTVSLKSKNLETTKPIEIKKKFKDLNEKRLIKRILIANKDKDESGAGQVHSDTVWKIHRIAKSLNVIKHVVDYAYPIIVKFKKKEHNWIKNRNEERQKYQREAKRQTLMIKGAYRKFYDEVIEEKNYYRNLEEKLQRIRSIEHRSAIEKMLSIKR